MQRNRDLAAQIIGQVGERLFAQISDTGALPTGDEMMDIIETVLDGYDRTLEQSPDWRWLTPTHTEIIDL